MEINDKFNETSNTARFISELELVNTYLTANDLKNAESVIKKLRILIHDIPDHEIVNLRVELYEKEIVLAYKGRDIGVHLFEYLEILENKSGVLTKNSIRLYRFRLVKYYLMKNQLEDAWDMANVVLNEKGGDKLSISELEVTRFIQVCVLFNELFNESKVHIIPFELFNHFASQLQSYYEKIRKFKEEFALELFFITKFKEVKHDFKSKDFVELIEKLLEDLKQMEKTKEIDYQIRFKRVFDYELWLESIVD